MPPECSRSCRSKPTPCASELLGLRQELAQVERDFSATRGAELLEANEQLVLAAMRAQAIADTARAANWMNWPGRGPHAVPVPMSPRQELARAEHEQELRDLRDANEQLVLAALQSQGDRGDSPGCVQAADRVPRDGGP